MQKTLSAEEVYALRDQVAEMKIGATSAEDKSWNTLAGFTDPVEFSNEVLGVGIVTDAQEEFLIRVAEAGLRGRWFLRGGHGSGKTHVMAVAIHFAWGPLACSMKDGKRVGCRLILSSTTSKSVQGTIYGQLLDLAESAQARGYDLPGFKRRKGDGYSGASRQSVGWHTSGNLWQMESLTSAPTAEGGISTSISGRHHKGLQIICTEEAEGGHAGGFAAMTGLMVAVNTCWIAATNPTAIFSPFGEMIEREPDSWSQIGFAVYRHPNVIYRKEIIAGSASHLAMDAILRTAAFEDRGSDAIFEADRLDFWYALPTREMEDKHGPRSDGIPGHPDAVPTVFRPTTPLAAGQWCPDFLRSDDRQLLFPVSAIRKRMLAAEYSEPDRAPDQVGLDCHPEKPPKACARWGPSARTAIDSDAKDGSIVIGRPIEIRWAGETETEKAATAACHLAELYGSSATYSIDQASGGAVGVLLEGSGAKVSFVQFGAPPTSPPTKVYGKTLNRRVEMNVHAALAMRIVSAPYLQDLIRQMTATGPLIPAGETGLKAASLRKKVEMTEDMDDLDALVLALDESPGEWFIGATGQSATKEATASRIHNLIEDL